MQLFNEKTILVGEDEPEVRGYIEMALEGLGFSVEVARDGDEVLSFLQASERVFAAVLLDVVMPNRDGLDTLREIRAIDPNLPVIMISGQSSMLTAIGAMKSGATDYLCKPVTQEELANVLFTALDTNDAPNKLTSRNTTVGKALAFTSANPRMREIQALVGQIGWSGAPVLIQGETGSGKEVLARELHAHSARANKPFLKLNCAALPSELVESELFGYERGAFTGAFQKKDGIFELADGGTILLDEIGDMDVRLQAKLLQVLQDQEFRRIGGKETIKVDVRVIAATHRDLETAIQDRTFREDLYYRMNVINLRVPPIRERREDIVPLGEFLMKKYAVRGSPTPLVSIDLRNAMLAYHWPGNVRELENYMRKLMIFRDTDAIARELHARVIRKPPMSIRPEEDASRSNERAGGVSVLEQVTKVKQQGETDAILSALHSTRWNRKQAAAVLNIEYKSLLYKMKKLGIENGPMLLSAPSETPAQKIKTATGS
jgi:two-component system response regulator AtoC